MKEQRIFISYKSEQRDFAERLRDQLRTWNCATWMDVDNILKGSYWPDEIDKGLEWCTRTV
jgi:TIR domain